MPDNTALYLTGAQLLANALAIPRQMENARKEEAVQQALLSMAGGAPFPQEQVDQAFRPPEGLAAKMLSGVGDVGAVMSGLLGSPVRPPRIDTNAIMTVQKQQQESAANAELAKQFTKPQAQALARMGRYSDAVKVEQGVMGRGASSELGMLYQSGLDQGMDDKAARAYALEQQQSRQERRMGVAGGISRGNTFASQGNADVIQDTNRAEKQRRGQQFLRDQGLSGTGGIVPQAATGEDPRNGGFTLIADTSMGQDAGVQPPGLQRRKATVSSEGEASVTFGPDPASEATAAGRARVLSVEEAQKLGVPLGTTVGEANEALGGQPPPATAVDPAQRTQVRNIALARSGVRKLVDATQALTQSPAIAASRIQNLGLAWDQWRGDPRAAAIGAASLLAPTIRKALGEDRKSVV